VAKLGVESYSGIQIRDSTRVATQTEIKEKAEGMDFVSIGKIDSLEIKQKHRGSNAGLEFFTMGILTDKSTNISSQKATGSSYSIFKISNLIKVDMRQLEQKIKASNANKSEEEKVNVKAELKAYTHNGYKNITLMAFRTG